MKALYVNQFGGPEKLICGPRPAPAAAAGQALVKIAYAGINFIDVYYRTGLYPSTPPTILGMEAAGVVDSVGAGVTEVRPGDRVAYAMALGSHAEYAAVPAWQLVPVPGDIALDAAAAAMLQGMTAHYLTRSTYPLKPGATALVHAAAGGAGQWIVGAAKLAGARVIGTTSSEAKAVTARAAGCDEVINYATHDFDSEVRRLTAGAGVEVVYDSVGRATWERSLDSLKPRGMMVSFGNASGPVEAISPLILSQKGSLFLTRPTLGAYVATREELLWRAGEVFSWLRTGAVKLHIHATYALEEAARAYEELEGRRTTGKLLFKL